MSSKAAVPPADRGVEARADPEAEAEARGPGRAPRGHIVVDVDPWSFVVLAGAALVAYTVFSVSSVAADILTGIGVGVLLGLALSPVVSAVQRRWGRSRGSAVVVVGAALSVAVAAVVLLVAPAAINQASDFSNELPRTVGDFY
ncbi:MAG: AI-2E family transporter, partial [Acidimicrobiales bacterium]|nr:AI-2E family transporter [Acidimicrobiales bacterium]